MNDEFFKSEVEDIAKWLNISEKRAEKISDISDIFLGKYSITYIRYEKTRKRKKHITIIIEMDNNKQIIITGEQLKEIIKRFKNAGLTLERLVFDGKELFIEFNECDNK
jgi:hypothetical protein